MDIVSHRQKCKMKKDYMPQVNRDTTLASGAATQLHGWAGSLGSASAQRVRKTRRKQHGCLARALCSLSSRAREQQRLYLEHRCLSCPWSLLCSFCTSKTSSDSVKESCSLLPVQAPSLPKSRALLIWEEDKPSHSYSWRYRWGCRAKCFFKQPAPRTPHFRGDPHQSAQRAEAPFSWEGNRSLPQQMSFSLGCL